MDWLTSLPAGLLVVGWLTFAVLVAFGARLAVRAIVPVERVRRRTACRVAA